MLYLHTHKISIQSVYYLVLKKYNLNFPSSVKYSNISKEKLMTMEQYIISSETSKIYCILFSRQDFEKVQRGWKKMVFFLYYDEKS